MKKTKEIDPKDYDDGMLPEYDFSGQKPVRGKYYLGRQKGYTVRVHNEDGTVTVRHYGPTITLDVDVAAYFPDSESVNNALRTLITLFQTNKLAKRKQNIKSAKSPQRKSPSESN